MALTATLQLTNQHLRINNLTYSKVLSEIIMNVKQPFVYVVGVAHVF